MFGLVFLFQRAWGRDVSEGGRLCAEAVSSWEHFEAAGAELLSLLKDSQVSWVILNTVFCGPNLAFCDLRSLFLLLSNF